MIKKWIQKWIGKVSKPAHTIKWRQKQTIEGIYWERIHYPYTQNEPYWDQDTSTYVYFLYRGV